MKNYLLKWLIISIAVVGIISLFFVFKVQKKNKICAEVEVTFKDNVTPFISEQNIINHLQKDSVTFLGLASYKIDLSKMESSVRKNPFVKDATCYFGLDGTLRIDIQQRNPILRVHPIAKPGYYIDDSGTKFPLSDLYTPNIKVATGYINEDLNKKLYTFTTYVNQSKFWKPFIEHIFVRPNKDIVFTTQIGGHEVVVGDTSRLEQKLNKLEKFYIRASANIGWEAYREINLKFKDQVICRK